MSQTPTPLSTDEQIEAGAVYRDGRDDFWTADVQTLDWRVIAKTHGATPEQARQRQAIVIAALSQAPNDQVERGWLIETDFGPHIHYIGLCDPHGYWREQSEKGRSIYGRSALVGIIRFCRDSNDAIRFARKADAEQLITALGQLLTEPRVCEHEWHGGARAALSAMPQGEKVREAQRRMEAVVRRIVEDVSCIENPTKLSPNTVSIIVADARFAVAALTSEQGR